MKLFRSSPVCSLSLSALSYFGDRFPPSCQIHPVSGGKKIPRGVQGCRGDPRRSQASILKLQVEMPGGVPQRRRFVATWREIHSYLTTLGSHLGNRHTLF
ncbi:hypothetical protein TNCV_4776591 [Trichonephila clavipes]|nr:hypothetical protein TNCV_4776591 [Trichonephila clavipes]